MGRGRRTSYSSSSSDDESYVPIRVARSRSRHHSRHRERRHDSPENIIINNNLRVPGEGGRGRAQSVGANPVLVVPQVVARSSSRHSRHSSSSSHSGRSRSRHSHRISYDDLPYDMQRDFEELRRLRSDQRRDYSTERDRRDRVEQDFLARQRQEKDARDAAVRDAEAAAAKEKLKHDRMIEEYKIEEARKKRETEDMEKRVLLEAEHKKHKEEEERKALKEKILREAKDEELKKKDAEREKEEWFNDRVRHLALEKGLPSRIAEDLLRKERRDNLLLEGTSQPTWIRIDRRHILPETLDHFGLPWMYSETEPGMIIIKEYIDKAFSQELFEHTQMIRKRKTITMGGSGYEKVTTLKPYEEKVLRKKDKMYLVRSKSKSPAGRRLSFIV